MPVILITYLINSFQRLAENIYKVKRDKLPFKIKLQLKISIILLICQCIKRFTMRIPLTLDVKLSSFVW